MMNPPSLTARRVWWLLSVAGAMVVTGKAAASDPPKEKYVFFEYTDRWVCVFQGEWELIGKLDRNGDFIHEHKRKAGQPASAGTRPGEVIINATGSLTKPRKVYEFRSGMLIPGELRPGRFAAGPFVPEAGGKIIPFKDYEYSPTATPIWNLPGVFVMEEEAARLKQQKPADMK
jgi:hypothetical protein